MGAGNERQKPITDEFRKGYKGIKWNSDKKKEEKEKDSG